MASHSSVSCLGNTVDREAWWATVVHGGCKQSDMTEQVNNNNIYISGTKYLHLYICIISSIAQNSKTFIILSEGKTHCDS